MDQKPEIQLPDVLPTVAAAFGLPFGFVPIESSNLQAVLIIPSKEDPDVVQLQVIFKNRTRYAYSDLPRALAEEIHVAPSAGKFLNVMIKAPRHQGGPRDGQPLYRSEQIDLLTGQRFDLDLAPQAEPTE